MGNGITINGLTLLLDEDSWDLDAIAFNTMGHLVERPAAAMAASPETLFTVSGGLCKITQLIGRVANVAIQGQATTVQIANDPAGAVAVATLTGATDLNADAIGTLVLPTGLATDVAVEATAGRGMQGGWIVQAGIITAIYGAVSTGELEWFLWYFPLQAGARIVAA